MGNVTGNGFPSQKKTRSQKDKNWAKQCVEYAETQSAYYNEGVRKSAKDKYINYQLYNGYIDKNDLELILNPHQVVGGFIPDNIPHYPIAAPKIDLLVGEELNRRFEYKVIVSNPDAISQKEARKAEQWRKKFTEIISEDKSEEEVLESIKKHDAYLKYDWQDIKELTATNILRYYSEKYKFKNKFNDCFKDLNLSGDEIIQCEIVNNEPYMNKLNPLNVYSIRSGGSRWLQDSDLIILEDYWNPGRIVDHFFNELTKDDITKIEENFVGNTSNDPAKGNIHNEPNLFVNAGDNVDTFISMAQNNNHQFGNYYDTNGNVRVLRVYWRSFRKVKKVKYYDEDGDAQIDFFPEDYKPDKDKGEESETLWINEMWEGTKIGDDIYIQMRPMPYQFNDINNPSKCHAGIIGYTYSTNQFQSVCTMDRMKQYQYLYDATKDKLNKAQAKYLGPLLELDLAKVPDNWDIGKWLHFAHSNGIATIDSFKEGKKGQATGKLAGNFNTTGKIMNLEIGNYMQNLISFLEYIKLEMAQIVGISPQREGSIANRETVGGVERAVNQSSHITEALYAHHELFKAKALETFLEVAKISLKTGNRKLQYILGDESIAMLEIDDEFFDGNYDILISFNDKYQQLESVLKELAQAGIQNDKMDFSTLMQIFMSNSLSETRRAIEKKELDKLERDQQNFQSEMEMRNKEIQRDISKEEIKNGISKENNIRDNETAILLKQMEIDKEIFDNDGLLNEEELIKQKNEIEFKLKELSQKDKHHKDEMKIKEKEIKAKTKSQSKTK